MAGFVGIRIHSGGGVITRMFVPETKGIALKPSELTPETIFARIDEIVDESDYRPRSTVDEVGISLMEAIQRRDA